MSLFEHKPRTISPLISLKPHYFGKISNTWVLPLVVLHPADPLVLEVIPATSMFRLYKVMRHDEHVGYGFTSAFNVINRGGYLLTKTERNSRPETFTVLLRLKTLVVYNFPNCGALAVSPKISSTIQGIFEEQ